MNFGKLFWQQYTCLQIHTKMILYLECLCPLACINIDRSYAHFCTTIIKTENYSKPEFYLSAYTRPWCGSRVCDVELGWLVDHIVALFLLLSKKMNWHLAGCCHFHTSLRSPPEMMVLQMRTGGKNYPQFIYPFKDLKFKSKTFFVLRKHLKYFVSLKLC